MSPDNQIFFELLKIKVVAMMQQSYPGVNPSISEWKGQEITDFQEDLRIKVNARISEKWFYTHMKTGTSSVPRIDMLNLLSKYAGYSNWDDFLFKNKEKPSSKVLTVKTQNRYFLIIPIFVLVIFGIFFSLFKLFNTREYQFGFYDADTHEPITSGKISVSVLLEGESPVNYHSGPDGSLKLKTDKSRITMVVNAPYYQIDTIIRILKKLNRHETIELHANDYALMIHYFSTMRVDDWEKRKRNLEKIFDDDAVIYQVFGDEGATGMALYNKNEFIDKMTVPSGSLKNIEILGSQYRREKIIMLRFRINDRKK